MTELNRRALAREALTSKQLEALGCIVAELCYLERTIEMCIGALAGIDEKIKKLLLGRAMIAAKIDLLNDLANARLDTEDHKKQLTEIIRRLRDCNSERVTAVHGIWFPVGEPVGRARAHHASGRIMTVDALEKLETKINAAHWDLFQFWCDVLKPLQSPAK